MELIRTAHISWRYRLSESTFRRIAQHIARRSSAALLVRQLNAFQWLMCRWVHIIHVIHHTMYIRVHSRWPTVIESKYRNWFARPATQIDCVRVVIHMWSQCCVIVRGQFDVITIYSYIKYAQTAIPLIIISVHWTHSNDQRQLLFEWCSAYSIHLCWGGREKLRI